MKRQNDKDKKIDKLTKKALQLDDICSSIYLVLLAKKSLRFNELYRSVIRLNPKQPSGLDFVSRPSFSEHLKHLTKQKLVISKKKGKQNVTYTLNKDALSIFQDDNAMVLEWMETLPKRFPELKPIDAKKYFAKLSKEKLEQEVNRDLNEILKVNLIELNTFVRYDLKINEGETDAEFWRFVGNPLYRMLEKSVAENCRDSAEYREKLFGKLESLIESLRKFPLQIFDGESED